MIENVNIETVKKLSKEINVSEAIAKALVIRGVDSFDKAKKFFRPSISHLYDPFMMSDMEKAVDRIINALVSGEKIMIYGDYDVDGTTGASMLYLFLNKLGGNVSVYIPDRFKEGYGISKTGINKAYDIRARLVISVDCGITNVSEIEYAKSLGIDFIICDHHEPGDILPSAYAVLNPLKENCSYPFKHLSGCGVAFKLIQAISEKLRYPVDPYEYLDYVAIAAAADVVPLVDENRVLVKYGLEKLNSSPKAPFLAIFEMAGLKPGNIGTYHIGFIIGPRINAVGRLGDATRAVKLLTSTNYQSALIWANELEEENRRRRKFDEEALKKAVDMIEKHSLYEKNKVIVLHDPTWHQGIIGIVAQRIAERYHRPTILFTTADGVLKGSARSIPGFDIYRALKKCETLLIQFGGHKYAAGMSLEETKLDEFKLQINQVAEEILTPELLTKEILIDSEVAIEKITPRFWNVIKQFEPFGEGNKEPVFVSFGVNVYDVKVVGNNHLKFKIKNGEVTYDAIGFGLGELAGKIYDKDKLDIVFTLGENSWGGDTFIQLKIKDVK